MTDFPEKVDRTSLNITEDKKEHLKQLFPEVFTEDKIDFDKLKTVLGDEIEDKKERYEMTWAGKSNVFEQIRTPSTGTLRPDREESKNFNETDNIYIEGENLEVLKLLQKSYYGKIKMIYIDPPYNTGNDFVYNDDYKENLTDYLKMTGQIDEEGKSLSANKESSGRFHSDWMNMMYPRLFLARNLLREDGVVFISIDDNEVDNLRKVCDEIFGEENFLALLVWENKEGGGSSDSKHFRIKHEYLIVYAKNIALAEIFGVEITNKDRYRYKDQHIKERGPYYLQKLGMSSIQYSKSLDYAIKAPDGTEIYPSDNANGEKACWRWSKEKVEWGKNEDYIVIKKDRKDIWTVYTKQYLKADNEGNYINRAQRPMGVINKFSSTQATKLIKKLFPKIPNIYSYPKPVELINWIMDITLEKSGIILDFFAGSSTTAHSVMRLNSKDNGNRKYILVQMPEPLEEDSEAYKAGFKNISEIGKERIRRAGDKIIEELKEEDPSIFEENSDDKIDVGFKVFKLDRSNFKEWDSKPKNVIEKLKEQKTNIKANRTKEEVLYEILLRTGMSLEEDIAEIELNNTKVYSIMGGVLLICLETDLDIELFREMAKRKPARVVCLDKGFHNNDQLKTNAAQIMKNTKYDGESSIEFKTI